jgi:hypothetical protein
MVGFSLINTCTESRFARPAGARTRYRIIAEVMGVLLPKVLDDQDW